MACLRTTVLFFALLVLAGCETTNPSFSLSRDDARQALSDMREAPRPAARPVLVLGGYLDPGLLTGALADDLRGVLSEEKVVPVSFALTCSFEGCYARVMRALEARCPEAFGPPGSEVTQPIDVVAISMGGLVARYCALPREDGGRRLQINRLFTISSPHRGANGAYLPPVTLQQWYMRPGSDWLARLDAANDLPAERTYCYTRLGDWIVGPGRTAPPGQSVWWVSTPFWEGAHIGAPSDPRIVADIARRLRGEPAYARRPAAALP